jgi:hypothetical protein
MRSLLGRSFHELKSYRWALWAVPQSAGFDNVARAGIEVNTMECCYMTREAMNSLSASPNFNTPSVARKIPTLKAQHWVAAVDHTQ